MYAYDIHYVPDPRNYLKNSELLARTIRAKSPLDAVTKANRRKKLGLPTVIGERWRHTELKEVWSGADFDDEPEIGVILALSDGGGIVVRQPSTE